MGRRDPSLSVLHPHTYHPSQPTPTQALTLNSTPLSNLAPRLQPSLSLALLPTTQQIPSRLSRRSDDRTSRLINSPFLHFSHLSTLSKWRVSCNTTSRSLKPDLPSPDRAPSQLAHSHHCEQLLTELPFCRRSCCPRHRQWVSRPPSPPILLPHRLGDSAGGASSATTHTPPKPAPSLDSYKQKYRGIWS
jgi:hypothetical protein